MRIGGRLLRRSRGRSRARISFPRGLGSRAVVRDGLPIVARGNFPFRASGRSSFDFVGCRERPPCRVILMLRPIRCLRREGWLLPGSVAGCPRNDLTRQGGLGWDAAEADPGLADDAAVPDQIVWVDGAGPPGPGPGQDANPRLRTDLWGELSHCAVAQVDGPAEKARAADVDRDASAARRFSTRREGRDGCGTAANSSLRGHYRTHASGCRGTNHPTAEALSPAHAA